MVGILVWARDDRAPEELGAPFGGSWEFPDGGLAVAHGIVSADADPSAMLWRMGFAPSERA